MRAELTRFFGRFIVFEPELDQLIRNSYELDAELVPSFGRVGAYLDKRGFVMRNYS